MKLNATFQTHRAKFGYVDKFPLNQSMIFVDHRFLKAYAEHTGNEESIFKIFCFNQSKVLIKLLLLHSLAFDLKNKFCDIPAHTLGFLKFNIQVLSIALNLNSTEGN